MEMRLASIPSANVDPLILPRAAGIPRSRCHAFPPHGYSEDSFDGLMTARRARCTFAEIGDAESDAVTQVDPDIVQLGFLVAGTPELARLVESWPKLPAAIRRAVLALVGSTERGRSIGGLEETAKFQPV